MSTQSTKYQRALELKLANPKTPAWRIAPRLGVSPRMVRNYWQQGMQEGRAIVTSNRYQDALSDRIRYHTPSGIADTTTRSMRSTGGSGPLYDWFFRGSEYGVNMLNDTEMGLANAYNINTIVYRCVQVRAANIAKMPYKLVSAFETDKADDPILSMIIGNYTYLYNLESDCAIYGVAYNTLDRDDETNTIYLRRYNPRYVTPQYGRFGIMKYSIYETYGVHETIDADEMIEFPLYRPDDDLGYRSPTAVAMQQIRAHTGQWQYVERFFQNDATPSFVLTLPADPDGGTPLAPQEIERVKADFYQMFGGSWNSHRPAVLTQGMNISQLSSPMKDLIIPDLDDALRSSICMAFGVPPTIALATEAVNYATAREEHRVFYEDTLIPEANRILDIINERLLRDMLGLPSFKVDIDLSKIEAVQEDQLNKANRIAMTFTSGFMSMNEARSDFNQMPLPYDYFLIGGQLIRRDYLEEGKLPAAPSPAPPSGLPSMFSEQDNVLAGTVAANGSPDLAANQEKEVDDAPSTNLNQYAKRATDNVYATITPADLNQHAKRHRVSIHTAAYRAYRTAIRSELDKWQTAYRKSAKLNFKPDYLPSEIALLIRMELEASPADADGIFEAWRTMADNPTRHNPLRAIDEIDTDGDGFASLEEIAEFWRGLDDTYDSLRDLMQPALEDLERRIVEQYSQGNEVVSGIVASWIADTLKTLTQPENETGDVSPLLAAWAAGSATALGALEREKGMLASPVEEAGIRVDPSAVTVSWDVITDEAIQWLQSGQVQEYLNLIADTTVRKIAEAATKLAQDMRPQSELAAYIQDELTKLNGGVNTISGINRASLIAQDIMTRTYAQAVQTKWSKAGVRTIRWRTANDPRVCPLCRSLNNSVGTINEGVRASNGDIVAIPAHVGCRCFYAPDFSSIE